MKSNPEKTGIFPRILLTIVALMTAFGSYIFDWNKTHIFNDKWPPHAKFHNAQTMLLGTVIGLLVLFLVWLKKEKRQEIIWLALVLDSFYWITQVGATLFPGTALADPEFTYPGQLPNQLIVDVVMLSMLLVVFIIESRRLKSTLTRL